MTPMGPADRELRLARAYLNRVAEPPAPALTALIDVVGPVRAQQAVRSREVPDAVAGETAARHDLDIAEKDLAAAATLGARLVVPEDDEWPHWAFRGLSGRGAGKTPGWAPPVALWVRGAARLDVLGDSAVSIVGSRAATGYGEQVATDLGYGIAGHGTAVVSGAAHGIDAAAHRGALAADGVTIAIQACGLDRIYPAGHVGLVGRIAESGAVVSEYPPGTRPAKHRFLVRNRLIAAGSAGCVVVEAGRRSGARRTAGLSAAMGRIVMAVPGPVTSAMSVGTHRLIRDEAALLVTCVAEVIEAVGRIGADLAVEPAAPDRPTDGLAPEELAVHDALPARSPRHVEELARDSGVEPSRVRAVLPMLELRGLVEYGPAGWRRRRGGA